MVCEDSAGVAVGRITDQRVFLTKSEGALWTRYRAEIQRWIYPSAGEREITLAHGGGTVEVAGVSVSMSGGAIVADRLLLLLLDRIPETTAYFSSETSLTGSDAFAPEVTSAIAWATTAAASCRR